MFIWFKYFFLPTNSSDPFWNIYENTKQQKGKLTFSVLKAKAATSHLKINFNENSNKPTNKYSTFWVCVRLNILIFIQ